MLKWIYKSRIQTWLFERILPLGQMNCPVIGKLKFCQLPTKETRKREKNEPSRVASSSLAGEEDVVLGAD